MYWLLALLLGCSVVLTPFTQDWKAIVLDGVMLF